MADKKETAKGATPAKGASSGKAPATGSTATPGKGAPAAAGKGPAPAAAKGATTGKPSPAAKPIAKGAEKSPSDKAKKEAKAKPEKVEKVEERVGGVKLETYQVILRPLVTEKGVHRSNRHNQYSFEISPFATKSDVRKAVESLFNVKVEHVCTQNRRGKARRSRHRIGMTRDWKKAIVTLNSEHRIDFF